MHAPTPANGGFKRQIVFRIGADDWPLLEAAAAEHGSIQAAVLAGIRALAPAASKKERVEAAEAALLPATPKAARRSEEKRLPAAAEEHEVDEEIAARDAAKLLGLKTSTVSGYIRSGRLAGRYDAEPTWRGWLTSRAALEAYAAKRRV